MTTIVYIDGENIFYKLVEILSLAKRIKHRGDLKRIDLYWLLSEGIHLKDKTAMRYYGTKLKVVKTESKEAEKKSLRMVQHKRAWGSWLRDQDIEFITAGNLKARRNGRAIIFEEKGVDVRIAVDIVREACQRKCHHAVIVSSDSDLIPAIQAARDEGVKVTYVAFAELINAGIALSVNQTLTFTRTQVIEAFDKVQKDKKRYSV